MPRKRAAKPFTTVVPHRSPQLEELLEAAKTCRAEHVRRFLAAGGLPDTLVELQFVDAPSAMVPLIFKAVSTHYVAQDPALQHESLELLLQAGASVNGICKDENGHEDTALTLACKVHCCTAPVRLLLAHGADPALQLSTGEAALHSAARAGRVIVCEMLLQADGCELEVRDRLGLTPLAYAVRQGHLRVVELLHRQWGADLSTTHAHGTLLHLAAASGQRSVLEYLLHNGLDVNAATVRAVTPMWVAAQEGKIVAVQTLLEHGASITAVDAQGENALMIAVRQGHTGVVKLLLSSGGSSSQPAVDVNAVSAKGDTALHLAACRDSTDAAALLLQRGASVTVPTEKGFTPLTIAAKGCSVEFVQLLLTAGAELTVGSPALHAAVSNSKRFAVLKLLLKQSGAAALIDTVAKQCDCCGPRTAIMLCEQPEHLKLLLAAGADVHKTTSRGNTALHVAAAHSYPASVICLLIKAGTDLQAVNNGDKTAAQVAADSGNTLAAALLTRAARDT
jgi:ankyrin repeat protein